MPVESHEVDLAGISDAFHREHERAYGYRREGHAIEVVNLGLTALGYVADPDLTLDDAGGVRHEPLEHRDVYFEGRFVRCPVYDRRGLAPGATISGPAVVEEFGSTTLIFPGWVANADSAGNLLMEAREAAGGGRSDGIAVEGGEPDPITLEVVQAFLVNVTREMSATLARSAWSPALTETLDFGLGILTADGDLVAASQELPFHTFAVPFHVRYALEVFGDDIHPGDVLLTNDPYTAGPHLNDMVVLCPFFDGDRLALFIAVRAHWTDVGGRVPGSMVGGAREIFEEGIRVPMVKIHNRGELNAHLLQTILTNCRNPDEREGDFASMLGTCKTAESRLKELFERYTAGVVERCIEAVLDRSDHTVRRAVAELPDGEYYYEEYMENTGIVATPVPLRCKLTISGDRMTFDFAGSSPQVDGPVNAGPAMGFTGVFNMVKSFLERETPVNSGAMRSVTVLQEEGSFLHALPPASVAAYSEVCYLVENAFIGLMAQIIPERIGVPPECGANHTYLSGWDAKRGLHWISYEYPRGGSPASPNVDGSHVVVTYDLGDIATILPVEKMELDNPVLVLRNELRRDSEGAGYRRSGLGGVREVKVLDPDGASLSLMGEMAVIPRMGLCGGYPGGLNVFKVGRNGDEFHPGDLPSKVGAAPMRQGDVVLMRTRGCGGWGDPLEREPDRVRRDVAFGYISEARARDAYGVALDGEVVDEAATEAMRTRLRSAREHVIVVARQADEYDEAGRRLASVGGDVAERLGLRDGDLVEYVPKGGMGAHLKAWIHVDASLRDGTGLLGPRARAILKASEGDRVWLRPLTALG